MSAQVHPQIEEVKEKINASDVTIFMKGTPDFPACGFSARACQVLKACGAKEIQGIDVLSHDSLWDALEEFTEWPTVPQIFIKGKFIGGCDIVCELANTGELQKLIAS
jgi:monothiol glutaredoxin